MTNAATHSQPAESSSAKGTAIATLTMNPTIDVTCKVDHMIHTHKIRMLDEFYAPGGGGINVSRVAIRLGHSAHCIYLAGGATGPAFDGLVDQYDLPHTRIPIQNPTRVAMNTLENATGKEYRFTPPGPHVHEVEWKACLTELETIDCAWFVLSGSLPPGVPADFYAQATRILQKRGIKIALDTSGQALREGLAVGGLDLVKPSQGELQGYAGRDLTSLEDMIAVARTIVDQGFSKRVAVTLGHEGAVFIHEGGHLYVPAIPIDAQSAVGAGDSFVAGMIHALIAGESEDDAFRYGVASGTAAVLTPGSGLAHKEDILTLYSKIARD